MELLLLGLIGFTLYIVHKTTLNSPFETLEDKKRKYAIQYGKELDERERVFARECGETYVCGSCYCKTVGYHRSNWGGSPYMSHTGCAECGNSGYLIIDVDGEEYKTKRAKALERREKFTKPTT